MADISPNAVESFNAKQKEFRENLVKAQQEKEASRFGTLLPSPDYSLRQTKLIVFY